MRLEFGDILVVNGRWFMPFDYFIRLRGSGDKATHNAVITGPGGDIVNCTFTDGVAYDHINRYIGRHVTIRRYHGPLSGWQLQAMQKWIFDVVENSRGYDFEAILAHFFGLCSDRFKDDPARWTCSQLSFGLFNENGVRLNTIDEPLPHPRWTRHTRDFDTVFEGIWNGV